MALVIDGSNVGGALGGRRGSREPLAVVRHLLPWARGRRRTVIVFDGEPRPDMALRYGSLEVRWGGRRSADQEILGLIGTRGHNWWVVTDDRALAEACKARGAQHLPVADLLAKLPVPGEAKEDPGRVDVDDWEEFFRREVE